MSSRVLDEVLGGVYSSREERLLQEMSRLEDIYGLQVIHHEQTVGDELMDYCRRRTGLFVIVALYSNRDGVFLQRVLADRIGWELPGTSLQPAYDSDLHDGVCRVIGDTIPGILVGEVEPMAIVQNTFKCGTESVQHRGVAFMARSRNVTNEILRNRFPEVQGQFVSTPKDDAVFRHCNQEVFRRVKKRIQERQFVPFEEEIESSARNERRQRLHKLTVSKLLKPFSSDRIRKQVLAMIGDLENKRFLDVSCGDDEFVFQIAQQSAGLCVVNDISWPSIQRLRRIAESKGLEGRQRVVYTNHTATALPFRNAFDIVLCKNTLHHMRNKEEFQALITSCAQACKGTFIIVEIENPAKGPFLASALHKYWYRKFLGDVGHFYFMHDDLQRVLGEFFPEQQVTVQRLKTIKGSYLIASVQIV